MIRRVVIGTDEEADVTNFAGPTQQPLFDVELRGPTDRALRNAEAPRDAPYEVRYRNRALGPVGGPLTPGSRLSLRGGVWEVLDTPRDLMLGRQLVGYAQDIHAIEMLYPLAGTVEELDGTDVAAITLAAWSGTDEHNDTGEYESRLAEIPIEYAAHLKLNRQIRVGSKIWKITSTRPDVVHGFVNAGIRFAHA